MARYSTTVTTNGEMIIATTESKTLLFLVSENCGGDYSPSKIEVPFTEDEGVKRKFVKDFVEKEISSPSPNRKPYLFGKFVIVKRLTFDFEGKEIAIIDNRYIYESTMYVFDTIEGNTKKYKIVKFKNLSKHVTISEYYGKDELNRLVLETPEDPCFIYAHDTINHKGLKFKNIMFLSKM